jgi:GntR family transcriptional regulator / MocR family aminotransferase
MTAPGPVGSEFGGPVRRAETDLGIAIDRSAGPPLPDQLERAIREMIVAGQLVGGAKLPSTRALAAHLDLSRGTVVEAYDRLQRQGLLDVRQGAAPRVAEGAPAPRAPTAETLPSAAPPRRNVRLHPALVPPGTFDRSAWRAAIRRALADSSEDDLRRVESDGLPALRRTLVEQIARSRGIAAAPDHLIITAGVTHALTLLAPVLRARGPVAVEDPGFAIHQGVLASLGCELRHVPADADGIDVDALAASGAASVLVTPAHQMPLGQPLSAERRAALLAWAARTDALVVEDDYDGELRYDRRSVRALQAAAPERVIYLGTTSKVLSPAVRIGWMIAPAAQLPGLRGLAAIMGGQPGLVDQAALEQLMRDGGFDRSVARLRRRCIAQRAAFVDALAVHSPSLEVEGVAAGLAVSIRARNVDAVALLTAAGALDLELYPVPDGPDVVIPAGFGDVHEARARDAADLLALAVERART